MAGSRTAFVLGGGGTWGSVQVGMLAALVDAGIRPDLVLGCSIGAINGAAFAATPDAAGVAHLRDVWETVAGSGRVRVLDRHLWAHRGHGAVGDPDLLGDLVDRAVPVARFEDLAVPFRCVAAEIEGAEERWFDSGLLRPALVASSSIPGLFPPAVVAGRHHYDGGLVNSIPIDRAVEAGATRIFVLQVGRVEEPLRPPRRVWEAGMVAFEVARRHRYATALTELPDHVEVHALPTGSPIRFDDRRQLRVSDTGQVVERLRRAEDASRAYLDDLDR